MHTTIEIQTKWHTGHEWYEITSLPILFLSTLAVGRKCIKVAHMYVCTSIINTIQWPKSMV